MSRKAQIFAGLCVVSVGVIAAYVYYASHRNAAESLSPPIPPPQVPIESPQASAQQPAAPSSDAETPAASAPPPTASVATPADHSAESTPAHAPRPRPSYAPERIFFRYNGVDGHYGKVASVDPRNRTTPAFVDSLACEVVYVAGGRGICLSAKRGLVTTYSARLFDSKTFEVSALLPLPGVPSRSRVSIDGKLAAYTVFVTGHGYSNLDFSTQTLILDSHTGATLLDLEKMSVQRDGKPFKEADFNFWGVTFTADAKDFYATLSSGGKHYLVKGNIAAGTATVLHSNVECPSLSPDGTRIAYKKRFTINDRLVWVLHVLDLKTDKETRLSETRSIDDQLEWLDSQHLLYSVPETVDDSSASTDVWVTAADGKTPPTLYLHKAFSPAAVRTAM